MSLRFKYFSGLERKIGDLTVLFLILFLISAVLSQGSGYALLKLTVWIFIAFVTGWYIQPYVALFIFVIAGIFESIVGFIQFITHKSVGFYFLGESFLSPLDFNVARTFVEGGRLLRAYGTFPHPNVLGAFLVISLISILFFAQVYSKSAVSRVLLIAPLFIIIGGLLLTFSRAAWIAALIGVIIVFLVSRARWVLFITTTITAILFILFLPLFSPRIFIQSHNYAITERFEGYKESFGRIMNRPWFGNGLTLRMPSDRQPTHNLYLIIIEEIGLFGFGAFFLLSLSTIFSGPWSLEVGIVKVIFITLLVVGLFDHFLWTLRPGMAMLWVIAGLLWQGGARSSTDRMQPSEG